MSAPHEGDKSAAFTGLILGAIGIFVLCFAIVRITNSYYSNKGHGDPGAAAHAAPAIGAPAAGSPAGGSPPATH